VRHYNNGLSGSVPYLTKDMLMQITRLPAVVHMPLNLL